LDLLIDFIIYELVVVGTRLDSLPGYKRGGTNLLKFLCKNRF